MTRFALKLTAAAVVTALSGGAYAGLDLDTPTTVPGPNYAQELIVNGTTAIVDNNLDLAGHSLGFGVSATQTRYIRYDLANGVFAGPAALANVDLSVELAAGGAAGDANETLAAGGTAGSNFVIYQITANVGLGSADQVFFDLGSGAANGIKAIDRSLPVTIKYSLYETAANAVDGGTTGRLATLGPSNAATFGTGLAFKVDTQLTSTADVTTLYKKFKAGVGGGVNATTARVGEVSIGVAPATFIPSADGTLVTLANLIAAGTKLTMVGTDLSAAQTTGGLFVDNATNTCGTISFAGANRTATNVDFVTDVNGLTTADLCFVVAAANATVIPAQSITVALNVVPAAGASTSSVTAQALGNFIQDGTVLKVPYMQNRAGQTTLVQLANTSANDAGYTVRCLSSTAAISAGLPGTVSAGKTKVIGTGGTGCPTATTTAVEFTLAVPEGSVNGTLVRANQTTGDTGFDGLVGNK